VGWDPDKGSIFSAPDAEVPTFMDMEDVTRNKTSTHTTFAAIFLPDIILPPRKFGLFYVQHDQRNAIPKFALP
jgi:hypothetical protein